MQSLLGEAYTVHTLFSYLPYVVLLKKNYFYETKRNFFAQTLLHSLVATNIALWRVSVILK